MRLIRIIIAITALCFIPLMLPDGTRSAWTYAQTGAVVSGGENVKITVTPAQQKEDAAAPAVLYRVMGVVLFIWAGLAMYLFTIDRRVARIEKDMHHVK